MTNTLAHVVSIMDPAALYALWHTTVSDLHDPVGRLNVRMIHSILWVILLIPDTSAVCACDRSDRRLSGGGADLPVDVSR